jgi:glycosyltransferase involved in cell wall biosynthesis
LNALARQSVHPSEWEIIAVGVGLTGVRERHPGLPLKIVELPSSPGPAHKRVAGVPHASGDWLLFVDDDIQPAPDFFQRLLELFTSPTGRSDIYTKVGAIGARLPGGRGTFFESLTDISNFWSQQSTTRAVPHTAWFLYSAAMIVRAEAYLKSGGFNPELMNGEDVDLTQRIQAAGYILGYEPSLVAYHFHGQDTLFRMWRYFWRNGNAAPYFFAQFGGVCCYSIKTVLKRAWGDLQMNRKFQKEKGVKLGWRTPWILLNYFIVEMSLERHYQMHLWENRRFRTLPARTRSDQMAARAFEARDQGRFAAAFGSYLGAMLLNFADPVRR